MQKTLLNMIMTMGIVALLMGVAGAQTIGIDFDPATDGIQNTVTASAGDTVNIEIVVDGVSPDYRGHNVRVVIPTGVGLVDESNLPTSTGITLSEGDIAGSGVGGNLIFTLDTLFTNDTLPQAAAATQPAVVYGITLPILASAPDGDYTIHIVTSGDPLVPVQIGGTSNNYLVRSDGSGTGTVEQLPITSENLTILDGTVTVGEGENNPPVANAGDDQVVTEATVVTLDGSGSSDPDGDTITYAWSQTSGPAVTISDASSVNPTFTAPNVDADTDLVFQLVVNDGELDSATDTVTVTVQPVSANNPPIADAGQDQIVIEGTLASLDGSGSSDPDGDSITFAWSQISGPAVTISDASAVSPTFTAPDVDADTDLVFQLIVNDGELDSAPDTVTITVQDTPSAGYIVMDGFGGFHPMGTAPSLTGNESYYPMFDVVQDFDILPDNSGIVLVDGWGANLVFSFLGETAQDIDRSVLPPFMPGMDDYYRAVKAKGDSLGYWIVSEKGELYGVGSALAPGATDALLAALPADITEDPRQTALPLSPAFQTSPIGEGENYVVDFGVIDDGTGVVFLTGWGDQVVFGDPSAAGIDVGAVTDAPYFGWDIARAIDIEPTGKGYMVLDGFGGIHPVAGARAAHDDNPDTSAAGDGFKSTHAYFGWDIAKKIAYTPTGTGLVMLDGFGGTHYDGTIVAPAPDDRVYFGFDIARDIEIYISTSISDPSEF
jgi:hypothetical protein